MTERILKPGDVVRVRKGTYYSITKPGTQWIIYKIDGEDLEVGNVLSKDRFVESYEAYRKTGRSSLNPILLWMSIDDAEFVCSLPTQKIENNADALNLLIKE